MTIKRLAAYSVGFSVFSISAAEAHVGDGVHGVLAGVMHPFTGVDHMALLLVAGLLAVQCGRWGLARTGVMVLAAWMAGLGLAAVGVAVPFLEQGIASGLVVLGAALVLGGAALGRSTFVLAIIGASALLHGQAHGLEATGSLSHFALGTIVGAALAMALGAALGRMADTLPKLSTERVVGGTMAALGVVMLATG